ncbi:hypothetical protein CRE_06083 [Caenorhabditis remanei]|uniref:F-box domain-containing protein n=1 Tax=Caenorhabditis remanei TaxID=31234 RepID=E3NAX0_CAERE|nr:hypothetical protein CRE_06083 [Caenorhabditis remanei]
MRKLKKQKTKRNQPVGEDFVDLRQVLPPTVMRTMIEKMSIEEHALLRAVCRYAHDVSLGIWNYIHCVDQI